MKSASISMSCGDIIYSLPLLRHLYEIDFQPITLLICQTHSRYAKGQTVKTYDALAQLLRRQYYLEDVQACSESELTKANIQLDKVRRHPKFRSQAMPLSFFESQNIAPPVGWDLPWLDCPRNIQFEGRAMWLVNATNKFNQHGHDWRAWAKRHHEFGNLEQIAFIGLPKEHDWFCSLIGHNLEYLQTKNLYEVAQFIKSSVCLMCEQSSPLTIAQGLGKSVLLAKDKRFNNCTIRGTTGI